MNGASCRFDLNDSIAFGLRFYAFFFLMVLCHVASAPIAFTQDSPFANALDVKSVVIKPAAPTVSDTIKAEVLFQETAPTLQSLYYRWMVNGEVAQESPDAQLQRPTRKGDKIEVLVFVGERREESRAVRAYATVQNAPPTVRKVEERLEDNGFYIATFESVDQDGDPVSLTLKRGPEGMTLDGGKNQVHWNVPKGTAGSFPVELLAADSSGGQVLLAYTISISQQ